MKLRWVLTWVWLGGSLTVSTLADAQSPAVSEPAPAAATGGVADVVYLEDGSMVRGTIVELEQGKSVTITLPGGRTRHFDMDDVKYAGPFASAPKSSTPAPEAAAPTPASTAARLPAVHFVAEHPLTVSVRTSTAEASFSGPFGDSHDARTLHISQYDRLCTTPCTAPLPRGRYRFSVSSSDGNDNDTLVAPEEVAVSPGDSVKAEVTSNASIRAAGAVILVVGGIGGTVYAFTGSTPDCSTSSEPADCASQASSSRETRILVGSLIAGGSVLAGLLMMFKRDEVEMRVTPGVASSSASGPAFDARRSIFGEYDPRGLTISARF